MWFITIVRQNLLRRKVRTLLTGVGVALMVMLLVTLLGSAESFERQWLNVYDSRGVDIVVLRGGVVDQVTSNIPQGVQHELRKITDVADVAPSLYDAVYLEDEGVDIVLIFGVEPKSFMYADLTIVAGRALLPEDRNGLMIGSVLASAIEKKPGESVQIEEETFTIVGIFDSVTVLENSGALMSLSDLQRLMLRTDEVSGFHVVLRDDPNQDDLVERVCKQIGTMTNAQGQPLNLAAYPTRQFAETRWGVKAGHAIAWLMSAVGMVVGIVGVLNIMMMTTFEQAKEIGVLMAIGWQRTRIVWMIVLESILIVLPSTAVGVMLGIVFVRLIAQLPIASVLDGEIPLPVLLYAFGLGNLVGVLGALYPAYYASRMTPTDAIRSQ